MIPLTLAAIAEITGAGLGSLTGPDALVRSVVIDSRQAAPGALFAALPGERVDGHDFAVAAIEKGAVAVLASQPLGVPALITPDVPGALVALARAVTDALPGLTIAGIARGRRAVAVFGPMEELGEESLQWHEQVGGLAARAGVAGLTVVGEDDAPMLSGAKADRYWHSGLLGVPDADSAVAALGNLLAPGDVVLVKASRAAGLKRVALAPTGEAAQ